MGDEKFALPNSAFGTVVKLITAYSHQRFPMELKPFAAVAGIDADTITRNNGFLISCGLITNTKKKEATPLGKELGLALDHQQPEAIQAAWKKVVDSNATFHHFVTFVKNKGQVDAETLHAQICIITGQPKTRRSEAGAAAIVNVLVASGVLVESEKGKYRVGKPQEPVATPVAGAQPAAGTEPKPNATPRPESGNASTAGGPTLNINIQVHISADATAEQIEKIFESMAKHLYRS